MATRFLRSATALAIIVLATTPAVLCLFGDEFIGIYNEDLGGYRLQKELANEAEKTQKKEFSVDFEDFEPEEGEAYVPVPARREARVNRLIKRARIRIEQMSKEKGTGILSLRSAIKAGMEEALSLAPYHRDSLLIYAQLLCYGTMDDQEMFKAHLAFRSLLVTNPTNETLFLRAADCLWQSRSLAAMGLFQKTLEMENPSEEAPNTVSASKLTLLDSYHFTCSANKHRVGTNAAMECYNKSLEKYPNNENFQLNYGSGLVFSGRFGKANKFLEKYVKEHPLQPEANSYLGFSFWHLGEYESASDAFRDMYTAAPSNPIHALFHAQALRVAGKDATREFERLLADHHWTNKWQFPAKFTKKFNKDSKPWHQAKKFEVTESLEPNVDLLTNITIKAWKHPNESFFFPSTSPLVRPRGSLELSPLYLDGVFNDTVCNEVQFICKTVQQLKQIVHDTKGMGPTVLMMHFKAGAKTLPTWAESNFALRFAVQLKTENPGKVKLRVGGDLRDIFVGKPVIFDPSFQYEWNNEGGDSLLFILDFWRHELMQNEDRQQALREAWTMGEEEQKAEEEEPVNAHSNPQQPDQ